MFSGTRCFRRSTRVLQSRPQQYIASQVKFNTRCIHQNTILSNQVEEVVSEQSNDGKPFDLSNNSNGVHPQIRKEINHYKAASRGDKRERIRHVEEYETVYYPRITNASVEAVRVKDVLKNYDYIQKDSVDETVSIIVRGRIINIRELSSKLIFFHILDDSQRIQVVSNFRLSNCQDEEFSRRFRNLRKGDIIAITGNPGRTATGELSIFGSTLPRILAPTFHDPPRSIDNVETRFQQRHVDLMINYQARHVLRKRAHIINQIRNYLNDNDFVEVQTPILSEHVGGAIARSFETSSTVFGEGRKLQLRIAPELWLKRLVIGGMERIYELGVSFRNENADATHNPEFTTCEFYEAYANIEGLIKRTEDLLGGLRLPFHHPKDATPEFKHYKIRNSEADTDAVLEDVTHNPADGFKFAKPFRRMDFISCVEKGIGRQLPNLEDDNAPEVLLEIFDDLGINKPKGRSVPSLLDALSAQYIEPNCNAPTFIMNIPACLSPLAKSYVRWNDRQRVAYRAELFVRSKEIANLYEEENSPFQQKRNFEEQVKWRVMDNPELDKDAELERVVDKAYLAALEWGLPPTGGWGLGIDRLCMLMTNTDRINEVMAFGGLRGASLASRPPRPTSLEPEQPEPENATWPSERAKSVSLRRDFL